MPVVWLWLDRDERGHAAAERTIVERLTAAGVGEVRPLEDTAGLDGNDVLRAFGRDRVQLGGLVDRARPFEPAERVRGARLPPDQSDGLQGGFGGLSRCKRRPPSSAATTSRGNASHT